MMLTQKKTHWLLFAAIACTTLLFSPVAFSAGLDVAITETTNIKEWGYKLLSVLALGYIVFNVGMAYIGRKSWGEVLMAVVYAAIAGAALVLGGWAWSLWGSGA